MATEEDSTLGDGHTDDASQKCTHKTYIILSTNVVTPINLI